MGNQKADHEICYADGSTAPASADCERLFDVTGLTPGEPQEVWLTLWNVDNPDEAPAIHLRVFSDTGCAGGIADTNYDAGTGDLCDGLQLKIQRYTYSDRYLHSGGPAPQCLFGCPSTGSLNQFAGAHNDWASGIEIDSNFTVNEHAYLVLTIELPDHGSDPNSGRGLDNPYMNHFATLGMTWRMVSA
jgi:hypothetical protein